MLKLETSPSDSASLVSSKLFNGNVAGRRDPSSREDGDMTRSFALGKKMKTFGLLKKVADFLEDDAHVSL